MAHQAESDPRLKHIGAVGAVVSFASAERLRAISRLLGLAGFELVKPGRRPTIWERLHDRGEDLLMLALRCGYTTRAAKPGTVRERYAFWISRNKLLERHAVRKELMR